MPPAGGVLQPWLQTGDTVLAVGSVQQVLTPQQTLCQVLPVYFSHSVP